MRGGGAPRAQGPGRRFPGFRLGVVLMAAGALFVGACGDDPPGPEELQLVVAEAPALGGAVIELSGEGIVGVRGPAGVEVVWARVTAEGEKALPRVRVVAILATPGPLSLTVEVARAGAPLPGATLIQASGADDILLLPAQLPEVRVLR